MHLRPVTGPRPERPRHGHCFLINPSGSLSLSLSQSRCVCRVFIFKDTAHIGPSNACPRAAPETTPLWRLFLIKLSLSLSLSPGPCWSNVVYIKHKKTKKPGVTVSRCKAGIFFLKKPYKNGCRQKWHTYMYVHIYVYIYIHTLYTYICMYVCMYYHMYVCMYVCMYVLVMHMYVLVIHTYICI